MKKIFSTAEHEALYVDLVAVIRKHGAKLDSQDVLAVAANIVGKLIAMQDQRVITREMAMDIVIRNIETGNQAILKRIDDTQGNA